MCWEMLENLVEGRKKEHYELLIDIFESVECFVLSNFRTDKKLRIVGYANVSQFTFIILFASCWTAWIFEPKIKLPVKNVIGRHIWTDMSWNTMLYHDGWAVDDWIVLHTFLSRVFLGLGQKLTTLSFIGNSIFEISSWDFGPILSNFSKTLDFS